MRRPIVSLRKEIAKAPIDGAGRRRYGKALRKRIVHFARAEQARGRPITKIAAGLGIRTQVLGGLLRTSGSPELFLESGAAVALSPSNNPPNVRAEEALRDPALPEGRATHYLEPLDFIAAVPPAEGSVHTLVGHNSRAIPHGPSHSRLCTEIHCR